MKKREVTGVGMVVRFGATFLVIGAIMFTIAGQLWWWGAWAYLLAVVAVTFWGRGVVMRKNPAMLTERAQSLGKQDVKPWDRVLMPLVSMIFPILLLLTAALDRRLGWSPDYHPGWSIGAFMVLSLGLLFANWAFIENSFFSATVRIQQERGHEVISSGPYAWVRHPGYAGGILSEIAAPILLGSVWALIPAIVLSILIAIRTEMEDRTLKAELQGYKEYTMTVRHRLIPGVW
jgi:protein-S-isoprenylcysteine O-methyltransferase Ste14